MFNNIPNKVQMPPNATDEERMRAFIEHLSGYIEIYHGGSLELVSFDGETLLIKMKGACVGCNLSTVTLHGWVEGAVRPFFPHLKTVKAV